MNLSRVAVLFLLIRFVSVSDAAEFESLFESHVFQRADGQKLPYRLMKPANDKADGSVKYPLVLFLHGAGERGTDNVVTLVHGMKEFAKPDSRAKYPSGPARTNFVFP